MREESVEEQGSPGEDVQNIEMAWDTMERVQMTSLCGGTVSPSVLMRCGRTEVRSKVNHLSLKFHYLCI